MDSMQDLKKIKSALISVYYKDNLEPLVLRLSALGVKIFSTGGTQTFIEKLGIEVTPVENLTSYPSILGGRVKTLHPKVFGGILGRREVESDIQQLEEYEIPEIDLVMVDLYPFEETLASGASDADIIEKIDIGGVSLIRAAAKNFKDVLIVSSREEYPHFLNLLEEKKGFTSTEDRRSHAANAFAVTSSYDSAIFNYFNSGKPKAFRGSADKASVLRYGENPHQSGVFYGDLDAIFEKLGGKELSYNNLLDADAACALIADFEAPTFAVIKHNNACGIASRPTILEAWNVALAADPVSAFGGVLISNRNIDFATATEINKIFFEIIIAPSYDADALEVFAKKTNRIILVKKDAKVAGKQFRTILNGVLEQDRDTKIVKASEMKTVTIKSPTKSELSDIEFANILVKHTKSNAIILVKNGQLLASGTGQTSRVDALRQAIQKAETFNLSLNGAVMASDAFFPFSDCVEIAAEAGITAIVQPGGSVKDKDSIAKADELGLAMVFSGFRHFKH